MRATDNSERKRAVLRVPPNPARATERSFTSLRCALALALWLVIGRQPGFADPLSQSAPTASSEIRIGLLLPPDPDEAKSLLNGAALGVEVAKGLEHRPVHLVTRNQAGQWGTEGNDAATLALDDEVLGLITPTSGSAAHQVLQVSGRTRIPVVSLCPDSSITAAGVPWATRIVARTDQEAALLFEVTASPTPGQGARRWTAVVPSGRAGREAAKDLVLAASMAGTELLEAISLSEGVEDWTKLCGRLLARSPKGILIWTGVRDAAHLSQALRQAGFSGLLAGPSRLRSPAFVQAAGLGAEGFLVADAVLPPDAGCAPGEFAASYRTQYGGEPDALATMAHDSVLLLARLGRVQEEIRAREFPGTLKGASGPVRFDARGNRVLDLEVRVCRRGEFVRSQKLL